MRVNRALNCNFFSFFARDGLIYICLPVMCLNSETTKKSINFNFAFHIKTYSSLGKNKILTALYNCPIFFQDLTSFILI